MRVVGLILAGGESRRMNYHHKGLLTIDNQSFLQLARERLSWCDEIYLSVKDREQYKLEGIRYICDAKKGQGPLMGMYSVMAETDADFYVVTSVDSPFVTDKLLKYLLAECKDKDACIPRDEEYTHPLCGVYRSSCKEIFKQALDKGMKSPNRLLKNMNAHYIGLEALKHFGDPSLLLANINTSDEYDHYLSTIQKKMEDSNE